MKIFVNLARLEIGQLFTQGTRRGHPCTLDIFVVVVFHASFFFKFFFFLISGYASFKHLTSLLFRNLELQSSENLYLSARFQINHELREIGRKLKALSSGKHFKFSIINEPFRLKVTSSKWHFVDWAHCRKTVSLNTFDEKNHDKLPVNRLLFMCSISRRSRTSYSKAIWLKLTFPRF